MIYPPKSYMGIAGDLHQNLFLIKQGVCIEVDILGNHMVKGPGDMINLVSAVTKHQVTTIVALTHVHCHEFDRRLFADTKSGGSIFETQKKFPSFKLVMEKVLHNIFALSDWREHKQIIGLAELSKRYLFDLTNGRICQHRSLWRRIFLLSRPIDPFGKFFFAWSLFIIMVYAFSALLSLQGNITLSTSNYIQQIISIMDCILWLDLYFRIQLPYFDPTGVYVTDYSLTFKRWLKQYAFRDFFLLFPFDMIVYPLWRWKKVGNDMCERLIAGLRLIKFFRCIPAYRNILGLADIHMQHRKRLQICRVVLSLFGLISTWGSLWIAITCDPGMLISSYVSAMF